MPHLDFAAVLHGQFLDGLWSGWIFSLQLIAITLCLALLRMAPAAPLRAIGFVYVEGIRSVPLLVPLLFWYFGVPEVLPAPLKERLYAGNIEAIAAIVALTLYTAAYMAEDIRSGLRTIPLQQFEAARALGFGFLPAMHC